MPRTQRRPIGLHLAWLLSVAMTGAFVTAMIVATGDLASLWPLYLVPIVIASLVYGVSGAAITVAITTALVAFLAYNTGAGAAQVPELVIGLVAYAISGVVIGVQSERHERQRVLLERDSTVDPLTGALRPEHLESRLAEEVGRSLRYQLACSCALISVSDSDGFRRQYGRVKSDLMLERLAGILRLNARETDTVGRWGPTAFALLMPLTGSGDADGVCERIRAAVASAEFEGDALEPVAQCTVDIARVSCPDDATTHEGLLALATERLAALSAATSRDSARDEGSSAAASQVVASETAP